MMGAPIASSQLDPHADRDRSFEALRATTRSRRRRGLDCAGRRGAVATAMVLSLAAVGACDAPPMTPPVGAGPAPAVIERVAGVGVHGDRARFALKRARTTGPPDVVLEFGSGEGEWPIAGDWDGDGFDTVGVFRPETSSFHLRAGMTSAPADRRVAFGDPRLAPLPVVGDWDGDGVDTFGVYARADSSFRLTDARTTSPSRPPILFGPPRANGGRSRAIGMGTVGTVSGSTTRRRASSTWPMASPGAWPKRRSCSAWPGAVRFRWSETGWATVAIAWGSTSRGAGASACGTHSMRAQRTRPSSCNPGFEAHARWRGAGCPRRRPESDGPQAARGSSLGPLAVERRRRVARGAVIEAAPEVFEAGRAVALGFGVARDPQLGRLDRRRPGFANHVPHHIRPTARSGSARALRSSHAISVPTRPARVGRVEQSAPGERMGACGEGFEGHGSEAKQRRRIQRRCEQLDEAFAAALRKQAPMNPAAASTRASAAKTPVRAR